MSSTLASADDLASSLEYVTAGVANNDTFDAHLQVDTDGQVGILPRTTEDEEALDELPLAEEEKDPSANTPSTSTKRNWKLPTTLFLVLVALLAIGISVDMNKRNSNTNKGSIASIQQQQAKQQPPPKKQDPKKDVGIADAPKTSPIQLAKPPKKEDPKKEDSGIAEAEAPKVAPVKPAKPPKKADNLDVTTPFPTDQGTVSLGLEVTTSSPPTQGLEMTTSPPTFYPTNQNTITVSTEVTAPPTVANRPADTPVIESPTWLG